MQHPLVLPCAKGSEQVLLAEAESLGLQNARLGVAVVSGSGDLETAYRLCLWSRVASRVLWIVAEGEVANPDDIYALARAVPWDEHIDADSTFAVNFNGIGQGIRNTQFGALKVKDAIADQLRDTLHRRPDVDAKNPDISIDAHLRKGRLTLALDLSGGSLHQRGYRLAHGAAPIKEHLAATLLYRAGWPQLAADGYNLIDPLCGSGTLLLEALLMAADIAPALKRPRFGFTRWQSHKPAVWKRLHEEAVARREAGLSRLDLKIWGYDHDGATLATARDNAARLDLGHCLHLERRELARFTAQPGYGARGLIITNPPYGERLGTLSELVGTYDALGAAYKTFPADWQMAVISSNPDLLKRLRLQRHKTYQAYNGGLETQIALYLRSEQHESEGQTHDPAAPVDEQARMLANRLRKNRRAAQKAAEAAETNAYRVYDQDMPEYAVAVDIYGDHVHVQEYAPPKTVAPEKASKRLLDALHIIPQILEIPAANLVLKTRERQRGSAQYQKQAARGEYLPVREGAATLLVNLHDYLDTGHQVRGRVMKYRILTPIRHGGKRIEPPAVVELTLVEAAPLLAAGVIERTADAPAQGWLALDPQTIADLLAPLDLKRKPALKKALELLHEQVDGSETEDGIALAIRDEDLTQADLDAAWALLATPPAAAEEVVTEPPAPAAEEPAAETPAAAAEDAPSEGDTGAQP